MEGELALGALVLLHVLAPVAALSVSALSVSAPVVPALVAVALLVITLALAVVLLANHDLGEHLPGPEAVFNQFPGVVLGEQDVVAFLALEVLEALHLLHGLVQLLVGALVPLEDKEPDVVAGEFVDLFQLLLF